MSAGGGAGPGKNNRWDSRPCYGLDAHWWLGTMSSGGRKHGTPSARVHVDETGLNCKQVATAMDLPERRAAGVVRLIREGVTGAWGFVAWQAHLGGIHVSMLPRCCRVSRSLDPISLMTLHEILTGYASGRRVNAGTGRPLACWIAYCEEIILHHPA